MNNYLNDFNSSLMRCLKIHVKERQCAIKKIMGFMKLNQFVNFDIRFFTILFRQHRTKHATAAKGIPTVSERGQVH